MTYPQTSPQPTAPAYPATISRIRCNPGVLMPVEKLEGPEFPLDLLKTDDIAYVENEKRWDDNVGQYPAVASTDPERKWNSTEELLAYLEDLAERQRLLTKGLFLLKNIGSDFVGRSGEL